MRKEQVIDRSSWNLYPTRSIADLYDIILEIHTEFQFSTLQIQFRGYWTPEGYKVTIWGEKIDLYIAIAPSGTPSETLPAIKENTTRSKNTQLPLEQQIYVNELQEKMKSLKEHLSSKVDEVLKQRYLDEMSADRIKTIIRECDMIWDDKGLSVEERINRLIPYRTEIYNLMSTPQLPDELVRTDTNISILMVAVLYHAQSVEKNARKYRIRIPKLARQLVKLVDGITTRMNETQNELNGAERDATKGEYRTYNAYLNIKIRVKSAFRSFEEQLELYKRLWEMPPLSTGTKIECLNKAIKLVKKQYGKKAESRCPHAPLVRKHLRVISGYPNELEKEGKATWQLHMANELLPIANVQREDCDSPALPKERFVSQTELRSVHIKTKKKEEGSIYHGLELFFQNTENTPARHFPYTTIEDGRVEEITLVRQIQGIGGNYCRKHFQYGEEPFVCPPCYLLPPTRFYPRSSVRVEWSFASPS